MHRRFIIIVMLASSLTGAGLFTYLLLHSGGNVTQAAFVQIQDGMTEPEVERILGGPADYYAQVCFFSLNGCDCDHGIDGEWQGERDRIRVTFYKGEVCLKRMGPAFNPDGRPPCIRGRLWRVLRHFGSE
jgi:hypothetical protein